MNLHPKLLSHSFLSILVIATVQSVSAPAAMIHVDISGVVGVFGNNGTATIRTSSYTGDLNSFDLTNINEVVLPSGTAFTARFTYDTSKMPAAVNSTSSQLDGNVPTPTHSTSSTDQWATMSVTIGGQTFSTAARPSDIPPNAVIPDFTLINNPLAYADLLSYGDVPTFFSTGFTGRSGISTNYVLSDLSQPLTDTVFYGRSGTFTLALYRAIFLNPSTFLPASPGIPTQFDWLADPLGASGFLYGSYGESVSRSFQDASQPSGFGAIGELRFLDLSDGLTILSAHAYEVPEPSTFALGCCGLLAVAIGRQRSRNKQ